MPDDIRLMNYVFNDYFTSKSFELWQIENDRFGHLLSVTMPGNGTTRVTRCTTDERGLVHGIAYQDGIQESFAYDVAGRLTNAVDRLGRTTTCTWLPSRKLASVTRAGTTVQCQYDNQFNLLTILDPLNRAVERYTLDARDRPVKVANVASQQMTVAYGLGGLVRAVTRFDGTTVSNCYDGDMRLVEQTLPGLTNRFSYSHAGRLVSASSIQPQTSSLSNFFDSAGRLTGTVASAAGVSASCAWKLSPAGFVTNVVSPAGVLAWTYDLAGRASSVTSSVGQWNWTYNTNNGLAKTMTGPNGITASWAYDILDRLTNAAWANTNGVVVRSWHYTYDAGSRVTSVGREDGSTNGYTYDDLDRLTSETRPDGSAIWSYDLAGNRIGRTANLGGRSVTITNILDASDRLLGSSVLSTNLACVTEVQGVSSETIGTDDRFGQLWVSNIVAVTPTVSGSNFWATMSLGVGSQRVVAAVRDAAGNVGYATNSFWATVVTNATYGYDAAGNTTNIVYRGTDYSDTRSLTWDGAYRLTSVATNGGVAENYGYNTFGQRTWTACGGVTNWHVYDGPHIVADLNVTGGVVRAYVYGPGIDNILAMKVTTGGTARTYFYITDRLGSVHALTDNSGVIVEQYRYDAWGRVLGVSDGDGKPLAKSAVGNRYLWQGREYSWATGLYYFRARFYDPITGRWLSNDPIGISGGLNQYCAFDNDPINKIDPSGLYGVDVHFGWTRRWAIAAGISRHDSWLIAEFDQGMDEGALGPFTLEGNPHHFQNYLGNRRQNDVFNDAIRAADAGDISGFGQALHELQDTFAHAGWPGFHLPDPFSPDTYAPTSLRDRTMQNLVGRALSYWQWQNPSKCDK